MHMQRDDLMKLRAGIQDDFLINKEKGNSLRSLRGMELTLLPAPEKTHFCYDLGFSLLVS